MHVVYQVCLTLAVLALVDSFPCSLMSCPSADYGWIFLWWSGDFTLVYYPNGENGSSFSGGSGSVIL